VKKVDLIKFRCTPQLKAALQREAVYRGITLTELIEGALEPLVSEQGPKSFPAAVSTPQPIVAPFVGAIPQVQQPSPLPTSGYVTLTTTSACPHGRPSPKVCWECA